MNRFDPALFSSAFTTGVRETWPDRRNLLAIDGNNSRRSFDRAQNKEPLHLVSAFATTARLVLGQEAAEGKSNELSAIPPLIERPSQNDGLKGALVSIDTIATNGKIAQVIKDAGAGYLLAKKANRPPDARKSSGLSPNSPPRSTASSITTRAMAASEQRELRVPGPCRFIRVESRAELADSSRFKIAGSGNLDRRISGFSA
jgi:hypothetical protein